MVAKKTETVSHSTFSLPLIKGILFQVLSVFGFSGMIICSRILYKWTTVSPLEVMFWRSFVLVVINLFYAPYCAVDILDVKRKDAGYLFLRCISGLFAASTFFFANYVLPPSISSSVIKLHGLTTTLISSFVLHESVNRIEIVGMVLAFGGVVIIAFNPEKAGTQISGELSILYKLSVPILSTIAQAVSSVLTRLIGQSAHYLISAAYFGISSSIFFFPLVLGYLSIEETIAKYTPAIWCYLFMVGFFGWLGQVTGSKALQMENAGRITAINFDTVVFLLFDVYFFGEDITVLDIFGMVFIMATVVGIAVLKGFAYTK